MVKVRLQYIDLLKVLSIFAIISIHIFMVWSDAEIKNVGIYAFSSIVRFGVPVFVMITGALMLNREIELGSFLKKKVKRLCVPFVFYYILTAVFIVVLLNSTHEQVQNVFAFRWYFWMILGVYLSIPVINKFVQHSNTREIEYFIVIFVLASVFYQVMYYLKIDQYLYLTLFLSPLGYLVLGYYLSRQEFNLSSGKIVTISLLLFIVSTSIKFGGFLHVIPMTDNFIATQSKMLSSWLDVGIFEIIQSSAVFLICKHIYQSRHGIYSIFKRILENNYVSKFILSVSRASYGMYLINLIPTVLVYYYKPANLTGTQVFATIILLSALIFFISWIAVVVLGKIPIIKNVSGYD